MSKSTKDCAILAFFTLIIILVVWIPHILNLPNFWGLNFSSGFNTIYRNFDGLEYVIIAKTFYNPTAIASLHQSLPANYFASHFPGYAIFIYFFAPLLGYLKSMLFISVLFTVFTTWAFYFLIRNFKLSAHPLFLSIVFLVLPARWVAVHSVGASEPTFIFFTITAMYFFLKFEESKNVSHLLMSGIFGLLAQVTRPQGILLFISLMLYIHYRFYLQNKIIGFKKTLRDHLKYFPLVLIPAGLLGIFYLFSQTYGDFWAYFHSGDNIHLTFPPFQVFNKHQFWVGDIWLEDIVYIFMLGFLAVVLLLKQKIYPMAFFVLTYLISTTLVAHRDISRYLLPIAPFVLIAFEKILTSREFRIILPIILLIIYLYTQNFLIENVAPIPNVWFFN